MPPVPPIVHAFLTGAVSALALVAALLFARFYRRTSDRLFLFFSAAFLILGLNNALFLFAVDRFSDTPENPRHPLLYAPRLLAFALILIAVIDKNRSRRNPPPNP